MYVYQNKIFYELIGKKKEFTSYFKIKALIHRKKTKNITFSSFSIENLVLNFILKLNHMI